MTSHDVCPLPWRISILAHMHMALLCPLGPSAIRVCRQPLVLRLCTIPAHAHRLSLSSTPTLHSFHSPLAQCHPPSEWCYAELSQSSFLALVLSAYPLDSLESLRVFISPCISIRLLAPEQAIESSGPHPSRLSSPFVHASMDDCWQRVVESASGNAATNDQ